MLAAPPPVYFRHVAHQQGAVWLLAEDGSAIYTQQGVEAPRVMVRLTDASGRPYSWGKRPPVAVAKWRNHWLLVDGSDKLFTFHPSGALKGVSPLPTPATLIVASPQRLWVYNGLMTARGQRIWTSTDGARFTPTELAVIDESSRNDRVLGAQIVLAGGNGGDFYYAHLIGPPVLHRVLPGGRKVDVPVAFSRTPRREALTSWDPNQPSLEGYSSPVGEIVVLQDNSLIVLRNREDVRRNGKPAPVLRLHVDRYSPNHRLTASAAFSEPVRSVLREDGKRVTVLTLSGKVVSAPWGTPFAGGVVR